MSLGAARIKQIAESKSESLLDRFQKTRGILDALVKPLSAEDCSVSSTLDTSPPKWHLAHTSWFFERFLLRAFLPEYKVFSQSFDLIFNSYYQSLGTFIAKRERPVLSRPSLAEVFNYRRHINQAVKSLLESSDESALAEIAEVLDLGLNHEQQHQELLLMDVKRNFFANPARPAYLEQPLRIVENSALRHWLDFPGGFTQIGAKDQGFAFDNERARHRIWLEPFALAANLVTNGEYLEFVESGAYEQPTHWLSDGHIWLQKSEVRHPLYWEKHGDSWKQMTLYGMQDLNLNEPVCHLSYYEAEAFARWRGCRLPTESEWEEAASQNPVRGQFLESKYLHPKVGQDGKSLNSMHGTLWQWTSSAYSPYPRYEAYEESLAEYNGKFFCNQMVLRGGSCITPRSHYRPTYRNFYYPQDRWQFSGVRLARDL